MSRQRTQANGSAVSGKQELPAAHDNRGHRLFRATQTSKQELTPLLKFLRHTQGVVTIVTAIGVVYVSNVQSVYYIGGALVTSTLAKLLKKVIREERPAGSAVTRTSGMPSTHSSTVTYMASYLLFTLLAARDGQQQQSPSAARILASVLLAAFPPLVMWSRVALGVHTPRQVIVGGTLGLTCAVATWTLWHGHAPWTAAAASPTAHTLSSAWKHHPHVTRVDGWIGQVKSRVWGWTR